MADRRLFHASRDYGIMIGILLACLAEMGPFAALGAYTLWCRRQEGWLRCGSKIDGSSGKNDAHKNF